MIAQEIPFFYIYNRLIGIKSSKFFAAGNVTQKRKLYGLICSNIT